MTIRERELRYVSRHLPKAKDGDRLAMANVAAAYRILGRHSLAYRWWKKGAESGDGSDTLDVGYRISNERECAKTFAPLSELTRQPSKATSFRSLSVKKPCTCSQ